MNILQIETKIVAGKKFVVMRDPAGRQTTETLRQAISRLSLEAATVASQVARLRTEHQDADQAIKEALAGGEATTELHASKYDLERQIQKAKGLLTAIETTTKSIRHALIRDESENLVQSANATIATTLSKFDQKDIKK